MFPHTECSPENMSDLCSDARIQIRIPSSTVSPIVGVDTDLSNYNRCPQSLDRRSTRTKSRLPSSNFVPLPVSVQVLARARS